MSPGLRTRAAGLVMLVGFAILLAPPVPWSEADHRCAHSYPVAPYLNMTVNCDSWLFLYLADNPAGVFHGVGVERQSRPLVGVIGLIASLPVRTVSAIVTAVSSHKHDRRRDFQVAFVLVNALILWVAVILALRLAGSRTASEPWMLLPLAMLLMNPVTKPFFWTAHTQLFTILASLLSVAVAAAIWRRPTDFSVSRYALGGFLLGIASLAYGIFLLPLAAGAAACVTRRPGGAMRQRIVRVAAAAALFSIPILAWRWTVVALTGDFYAHETRAYNQFVWIPESLSAGEFVETLGKCLRKFTGTLTPALGPAASCLGLALIAARRTGVGIRSALKSPLWAGAACALAVSVPFFALMGFYKVRLTWELAPPLILVAADLSRQSWTMLSGRSRKLFGPALGILAIAYFSWRVFEPGPYL